MYATFSQVFIALIFAAYLVFLAALTYWALGGQLHFTRKKRSQKKMSRP